MQKQRKKKKETHTNYCSSYMWYNSNIGMGLSELEFPV